MNQKFQLIKKMVEINTNTVEITQKENPQKNYLVII